MRFNILILLVLSALYSFAERGRSGLEAFPSDSSLQNTIPDTTQKTVRPSRILFDLNGILAQGRNSQYFNGYFEKGRGVQLALMLFSNRYYSVRFKTAYINYTFNQERFKYINDVNVDLKVENPETITLMPDFVLHPLPDFFVNPYVFLGLGMQVGTKDAFVSYVDNSGAYKEFIYQLGSRYMAQAGFGISKKVHDRIHVNLSFSRNVEFLENAQSKDIFYDFKENMDGRYKYNYYCLGIQYMIK